MKAESQLIVIVSDLLYFILLLFPNKDASNFAETTFSPFNNIFILRHRNPFWAARNSPRRRPLSIQLLVSIFIFSRCSYTSSRLAPQIREMVVNKPVRHFDGINGVVSGREVGLRRTESRDIVFRPSP